MHHMTEEIREGMFNDKLKQDNGVIDQHSVNCNKDKLALIWDGGTGQREQYTFSDLGILTNRFANVLKSLGITKGDRICLYIRHLPEAYISFVGVLKTGAVAVPVPITTKPENLCEILKNSAVKVVVTEPDLRRRMGGIVYELFDLQHIVVVNKDSLDPFPIDTADLNYDEEMAKANDVFETVGIEKSDNSFIHYKQQIDGEFTGVVYSHSALIQHCEAGSLVVNFDVDDVYWCTPDFGTLEGIAFGILAPWMNGITLYVVENDIDASSFFDRVQSVKITLACVTSQNLDNFMQGGFDMPKYFNLSTLRHMVCVGKPPSYENIDWCLTAMDKLLCYYWCEPETGTVVLGNHQLSRDKSDHIVVSPLFGIVAKVVDSNYYVVTPGVEGFLALKASWPAMFNEYWDATELYDSRFYEGWYISNQRAIINARGEMCLVRIA